MPLCLAIKRSFLEEMDFWKGIPQSGSKLCGMVGLSKTEIRQILQLIQENGKFKEREGPEGIERKPEWQQVIFYGVIRKGSQFFVYQRGRAGSGYKEKRLQAKLSIGIGGHIEPFDNTLMHSLYREVDEETVFLSCGQKIEKIELNNGRGVVNIEILGLLKDDSDEVGTVHLGLVCQIDILNPGIEVRIRETGENIRGRIMDLQECQDWAAQEGMVFENWTKIVMDYLIH